MRDHRRTYGRLGAATRDRKVVVEGEQVVVGNVDAGASAVGYEVLCRRHHLRRMTAIAAHAAALSPDTLPFDLAPAAADVPAADVPAADVPAADVPAAEATAADVPSAEVPGAVVPPRAAG